MKASDLRIGNYFWYIGEGEAQLNKIDAEDILRMHNSLDYLNLHEPIEVNVGSLKLMGAEPINENCTQLFVGGIVLEHSRFPDFWIHQASGSVMFHVHQLQNLIHALTGEEIEIIE